MLKSWEINLILQNKIMQVCVLVIFPLFVIMVNVAINVIDGFG